jgi:hypothetical protein
MGRCANEIGRGLTDHYNRPIRSQHYGGNLVTRAVARVRAECVGVKDRMFRKYKSADSTVPTETRKNYCVSCHPHVYIYLF